MFNFWPTILLSMLFATTSGASSQSDSSQAVDGESVGVTFADTVRNRWQVGVRILGRSRSVRNLLITIPIPNDWPEQQVELREEDIPPEVGSVEYRELNSGVKQMVLTIPKVNTNQLIELTATYDVATQQVAAPTNTEIFKIPKKVGKQIKEYLGVSPQISYRNAKFRKQVKQIIKDEPSAWKQVEAVYDWIRENIAHSNEQPTDTISVFRSQSGGREDVVRLFVAMCRSVKIPARVVWTESMQYAEFYLVDETGGGHWFPANVSGRRDFGRFSHPQIILQKGDNIKVPEKEQRQKFCAEFVFGEGKVKPVVEFSRKRLPVTN